jgi:exopolyphosphatase/guanosine-5'-triphosphate,3'-diphosphate pyrophosphatase
MIGGSWRAVGRVMMKKIGLSVRQVHGFSLNAPLAYALAHVIMRQKPSSFKRIHKKIAQRADVLPIASATMAKIIERAQPTKVVFSGHGVREGLVQRYA